MAKEKELGFGGNPADAEVGDKHPPIAARDVVGKRQAWSAERALESDIREGETVPRWARRAATGVAAVAIPLGVFSVLDGLERMANTVPDDAPATSASAPAATAPAALPVRRSRSAPAPAPASSPAPSVPETAAPPASAASSAEPPASAAPAPASQPNPQVVGPGVVEQYAVAPSAVRYT